MRAGVYGALNDAITARCNRGNAMTFFRCCFLIALLASAPSFAQRKVALEVTHVGNDVAGHLLAAEVRDAVRKSDGPLVPPAANGAHIEHYGMRLTSELARPRIRLQLLTASIESAPYTAVSVNVVYDSPDMPLGGAFVRGMLETCKRDELTACAVRILARARTTMDWLREQWPSLWRTL